MQLYYHIIVEYIPWITSLHLDMMCPMIKGPNKTLMTIGKNLRRVRTEFGLSQEQLALEAEIDRTYVSQIERGIANPSILKLKKIADCLKVGLAELTVDA